MLKRIVACAKNAKASLAEAAVQVQYADRGLRFPSGGRRIAKSDGGVVDVPRPPQDDFQIYAEGLQELRAYNPKLAFWGEVDEKAWTWPDPERPEPKVVEKPKVRTDMTRAEAEYWLGVLRRTLCSVIQDNVKGITLFGGKSGSMVMSFESDEVNFRERNFDDDDCFDRKAVTHIELRGYLPVQERRSSRGNESFSYYDELHTRGQIRFECCMGVISHYLCECFRLHADVKAIEITPEHWTIPVCPIKGMGEE